MSDTKRLSQKIVFQSKFFRIQQINVSHNGKNFTKDVVERNPVVFILPLTENNEVYLVSQYRDSLQKTLVEVVAGTMDLEEDSLLAAKRELSEETGLTASRWDKLATWELSANMSAPIHVFLARDLVVGEAHNDEDEDITVLIVPLREAIHKIMTGEIGCASHVGALLLLEKKIQEGKI
jgi:ADP-ribose pyrophosphatase